MLVAVVLHVAVVVVVNDEQWHLFAGTKKSERRPDVGYSES